MFTPFLMMSYFMMFMSSLMAISSTNWIFMWAALELNLLSFIPILMQSKLAQEVEATVKYFLVQAIGSSILLMSSMSLWFQMNILMLNSYMAVILLMALILKMGMAPCHLWYPSVMTSISWMAALILSTWQKLAPLIIMSFILSPTMKYLMIVLACMNAIVGGIVGMNQSHLRTIMAYSSITHLGWMTSLIAIMKPMASMIYFFIYSVIISPMFIMLHLKNSTNSNNLNKLINQSPSYQIMIPILLLSLSGLPPLLGFFPKWMTLSLLIEVSPPTSIILIIGSLMNTYFYLNIMFNFMLSMKYTQKTFKLNTNNKLPVFTLFGSMTLLVGPMSILLY